MKKSFGWENAIRSEFGVQIKPNNLKRNLLEMSDLIFCNSKIDFTKLTLFLLKKIRRQDGKFYSYFRHFITRALPFNPLSGYQPSPINISLLVAKKDIEILPYSLAACIEATVNPILKIRIVCPENTLNLVLEKVAEQKFPTDFNLNVITDESILSNGGLHEFSFSSSVSKMETLKLVIGYLDPGFNLIIDADTLLLRQRNWCSEKTQISPVGQEYFVNHNIFVDELIYFSKWSGLGFVTHHGLFHSSVVKEIIDRCGGLTHTAFLIDNGIKVGWEYKRGFPSEWQLYGEYCYSLSSQISLLPASFINLGIPRSILPIDENCTFADCVKLLTQIKKSAPTLGSLSLHAYK